MHVHLGDAEVPPREIHQGETNGENGRANEIPRSRFSSDSPSLSPLLSSIFSSFFFASFFYFAPSTEHVHGSGEHFRSARPGGRYAGEYLSERKTLSVSSPSPFALAPREERGGGSAVCLRKKVTPSGAAAARITLFARGRARAEYCEGKRRSEGERGEGEGKQKAPSTHAPNFGKHLADSRRSFSPPLPLSFLIAPEKSSRRALWKCSPPPFLPPSRLSAARPDSGRSHWVHDGNAHYGKIKHFARRFFPYIPHTTPARNTPSEWKAPPRVESASKGSPRLANLQNYTPFVRFPVTT